MRLLPTAKLLPHFTMCRARTNRVPDMPVRALVVAQLLWETAVSTRADLGIVVLNPTPKTLMPRPSKGRGINSRYKGLRHVHVAIPRAFSATPDPFP